MNAGKWRLKRSTAFLLALLMAAALFPMPWARADSKIVRVGWYESPFNQTDPYGRRSGYAYGEIIFRLFRIT